MATYYTLCIFLALLGNCLSKNALVVRECDDIPVERKVISLNSYAASPEVIPIPGEFNLSVNVDLHRDLDGAELDLEVSIKKFTAALYIPIPCLRRVGSCKYDLCTILNYAFEDRCPKVLRDNNIPCLCDDLKAGTYKINDDVVKLPRLGPLFSFLARGDYKVDLKLRDRVAGGYVGCLHIEGSVRDPTACEGWGCRIGRLFGGDGR